MGENTKLSSLYTINVGDVMGNMPTRLEALGKKCREDWSKKRYDIHYPYLSSGFSRIYIYIYIYSPYMSF